MRNRADLLVNRQRAKGSPGQPGPARRFAQLQFVAVGGVRRWKTSPLPDRDAPVLN